MFNGLSCSLDEEFIHLDETNSQSSNKLIGDQTILSQDVTIGEVEQNQDGEEFPDPSSDFNNCEEIDSFLQQEFSVFNEEYDALPVTAKFPAGRSGICKIFTRGKGKVKRNFIEFNDSRDAVDYFRSTLFIQRLVAYQSIPSTKKKEKDFLNNLVSKGITVETIQKYLCSGIMSRSSNRKKYIFLFNNPITPRDYVGSVVDPVFIQMIPLDQSTQSYSDELVESLLYLQVHLWFLILKLFLFVRILNCYLGKFFIVVAFNSWTVGMCIEFFNIN
jgi:hypothetical protein